MKRIRRKHCVEFKVKIAIEAIKKQKTLAKVS